MKKVCIIACSLLVVVTLALGITYTVSMELADNTVTLCDMDYDRVSY